MAEEKETGVYVFCGIHTEDENDFGTVEVEGEKRETYLIRYKDAAFVAATVPMKIYSPNQENLMMHQSLVAKVMEKNDSVIPVSFGNVFKTKEDVKVLLEKLYPQFEKLFPEIKGKFELGLKVIGKQDYLESTVKGNESIKSMSKNVQGKSKDAAYFDRMKLGEATQKIIENLRKDIETDIYKPLENISTAGRINDPQGEKVLLNAAFLVDREHDEKFDAKVNELYEKYQDKVDFKYTGPWPAYNFVNIRLNIEGA